MALCEALLKHEPVRGVDLWRALRPTLATHYIGAADVEEILHMVFRVPSSPPVETLKGELLALAFCNSDKALYQLALTACYNGNVSWLMTAIEKDRTSTLAWHRKRAVFLSGFTCTNALPVPEAWPDRELKATQARLTVGAARQRYYEACARHWFAATEVLARLFELLPSPPLTTGQVDLLRVDNVASGTLPGLQDLNIQPKTVEEVVPTYILRSRASAPH